MKHMDYDFTDTRMELNEDELATLDRFAAYAEGTLEVPTLAEVEDIIRKQPFMVRYKFRQEYIGRFGFALPCREWVRTMVKLRLPIVSVGCGTGYLERLLRNAGVSMLATDLHAPQNGKNRYNPSWPAYLPVVSRGGVAAVTRYPERAVLMSWPTYGGVWAYNTAKAMRPGSVLIYIGEGENGCTACDKFHSLLDRKFEEVKQVGIPQFDGIHDHCWIYRKI